MCTIEFQREALENANTNTEVLKNMGYAAKALENAHKEIGDADKVNILKHELKKKFKSQLKILSGTRHDG